MQALLIKIVKIIVTIFCSFIILGGILMIADEPVNKTNDNITVLDNNTAAIDKPKNSTGANIFIILLLGVLPIYLMWFRKRKINTVNASKPQNSNAIIKNTAKTIKLYNNNIPTEIFNLLWFINGKYKNYIPKVSTNNVGNIIFTIYMNTEIEPSAIDVNLKIQKPKNIMFVESLRYFPRYDMLTPEQRWVYLNWLQDIRKQVDIGYVFLFYYGLERWLFTDNYEQAFLTILSLRKYHKNSSFQSYSFNVLIAALLFHNREDLFEKLIEISDDITVSGLYLYLKKVLNMELNADEIISIASNVDFTNKRYIKSDYELFKKTLIQLLNTKYNSEFYSMENIDLEKCSLKSFNIVANTSMTPREINLPNIMSNKAFKKEIYMLLEETHENVKVILKENRKNKDTLL